jgi:ectoine hydroxylase-related dioxygenase (phytanoyl-CoA dioxygenase family)
MKVFMEYNISSLCKIYYKNGWVVLKSFLKNCEVEELKSKCFQYLKNNFQKYEGKDINYSRNLRNFEDINSFHKASDIPAVKKIANSISFKKLIRNFLENKNSKYMDSEIFAKPAYVGLKSPLHQDNYYWAIKGGNALTVWLALDDASKKNGGIYYYNKSHKIGILEHQPSFAKGSSQTIKNIKKLKKFKKIFPNLKKGDLVIHHSQVAHGSNANTSAFPRTGLTFQFKTQSSKILKRQLNIYLRQLKFQIESRSQVNSINS